MLVTFFGLLKISLLNLSLKIIFFKNFSINLGLMINFRINSLIFLLTVFLISLRVSFYIYYYMRQRTNFHNFHIFILLFILSIILLITRGNWITIFIGWDGLGIRSYFLVIYYNNQKSFNAGSITIFSNRFGDIIFIAIIRFLFFHTLDFKRRDLGITKITILILLLLFSTKRAQFPFSSWLPAAIAAPTPISALVHSSTLVTAGIFILYQLWPLWDNWFFLYNLQIISLVTLFYRGSRALCEQDIKKIVALSTLNQLSLILLTFSTKFILLGFFHLLTHAFFKSSLFLTIGIIIHQSISLQDGRFLLLQKKINFFFIISLFIRSMNLIGQVFTSGFFSKDLILENRIFNRNRITIIIFFTRMIFTFFYNIRLFKLVKVNLFNNRSEFSIVEITFLIPVIFLQVRGLVIGFFLYWNFLSFSFIFFHSINFKLLILILPIILIFQKNREIVFLIKKNSINLFSLWRLNLIRVVKLKATKVLIKAKNWIEQGFIFFQVQEILITKMSKIVFLFSGFSKISFINEIVVLTLLVTVMVI